MRFKVGTALVLGGGGPVGIAWEAGLLIGLLTAGIPLDQADAVIGTSAGSVVGATLTVGADLHELVELAKSPLPLPEGKVVDLAAMQAAVTSIAAEADSQASARTAIGNLAMRSDTVAEEAFLKSPQFTAFAGRAWPRSFSCTAIDVSTGQLRILDETSNVSLDRAVAASCAVPTIFPPVTVGPSRYIDGGMSSTLNANLAHAHERVLVVSCFALTLPDTAPASLRAAGEQQMAELNGLRKAGATVTVIEPDAEFLAISGWGAEVMNINQVAVAYQAGLRLGEVTATRVLGIVI